MYIRSDTDTYLHVIAECLRTTLDLRLCLGTSTRLELDRRVANLTA